MTRYLRSALPPFRPSALPPFRPSALPPLERRPETERPEAFDLLSILGNRVVQPRHRKTEEVGPEGEPQGLQRRANPDGVVAGLAAPLQRTLLIPREADIVEDRSFERRKGSGHTEGGIQNREPQLEAADTDLGP